MTLVSRLVARIGKLPPAETYDVVVERDLKVIMPDGVILLANRYAPGGTEKPPLILIRCCYGRQGIFGLLYGRLFAERGFQVLVQSTRGTFGSGGTFNPFGDEHVDGLATVAWLKQQSWFPGSFMTNGASYLGFVQWAIAHDAGPELKAMAIQISTSEFRSQTYTGEAFALDTALSWTNLIAHQEQAFNTIKTIFSPPRLGPAFAHLPLKEVDRIATGKHARFFQEWLEHNQPGDDYWQVRAFDETVKDISIPIHLIGGWYDIFLPWQLQDYRRLRDAGKHPSLTIGPWSHSAPELIFFALRESLAWLKGMAQDDESHARRALVRIFVTGANEWRDLDDWPPPGRRQQSFYLQPGGALAPDVPAASEPDHYRYDPGNPTPSLAGPLLTGKALPTDNRQLEARSDVLLYTSAPLADDLEVIGPVQADLYVKSSLEHTDFFVRLCDVDGQGKSLNVCDALQRVKPESHSPGPDGTLRVTFDLWPTAHRFRAGHQLRVQVSSGAHPRYARNPGTGEPLATATKLVSAEQLIYHDHEHPSSIVLSSG